MNLKTEHEIECPYRGDNVKSVTWFREDSGVLPHNMVVNGSSLIIKNAQLSDSALYTCKVEGQINTDQKSINITIYRKYTINKVLNNSFNCIN
jgi:Immunoglobulin I-set domain.